MAWKEVSTNAIDIKKQKGVPFIGTYTGKRNIETKIGPQVIWQLVDEDETPVGLYGFTGLNRCMETIRVGTRCRIIYQGTKNVKTKFGMKDVHQVTVEVEEGATVNAHPASEDHGDPSDAAPWPKDDEAPF